MSWPRVAFVPRPITADKKQRCAVESIDRPRSVTLHMKSETVSGIFPIIHQPQHGLCLDRATNIPTPLHLSKDFLFESNQLTKTKPEKANHGNRRLWPLSTRQKFLALVSFGIIVIICCISILVPTLVIGRLNRAPLASDTQIKVSTCSRITCISYETPSRSSKATLIYRFDGTLYDSTGLNGGVAYGVPVALYFSPQGGIASQTDFLNSFLGQYISVPYINLSQQSFTFQIWLIYYFDNATMDHTIFTQCGFSDNICFRLSIRENRVALSFDANNPAGKVLVGSSFVRYNIWNHISVVYDAVSLRQMIYLNGRIDAVSRGLVYPYQGTSKGGSYTRIGANSSIQYSSSYFYGYLDQLIISSGTARTACQILNDVTLLFYFPFDSDRPLMDESANSNYGYSSNTYTISKGHTKEAILFNTSTSYFQSPCLPTLRSSTVFTYSLWVYPMSGGNGGTLIHASLYQNGSGNPCYDLLGLTPSGQIVMQLVPTITNSTDYQGPIIPTNTWTHIALIYGYANGMRLFINGEWVMASRNYVDMVIYTYNILFLTLGNNNPQGPSYALECPLGGLTNYTGGPFYGAIDDFRYYTRELDMEEIRVLANM